MLPMRGRFVNRKLIWDEENRLLETNETNNVTRYRYDHSGNRTIKSGKYGEVLYVNNNFTVRNGELESKHIFAGNSRLCSKMVQTEEVDGTETKVEKGIYYYHADHLGSSSSVTNKSGGFHEHIEYFPYGETWVHEKVSDDINGVHYKFTGKEQDPETGLYYFGARYYDPRLSRWVSVDPILGKYLPVAPINKEAKEQNAKLPAGGVFQTSNLAMYNYVGNNPLIYVDPTGKYRVQSKLFYLGTKYSLGGLLQEFIERKKFKWGYMAYSDYEVYFGKYGSMGVRAIESMLFISFAEEVSNFSFSDSKNHKNIAAESVSSITGLLIGAIDKLGKLGGPLGAIVGAGISETWHQMNKTEQNAFADILTFKIYKEKYGVEKIFINEKTGAAEIMAKEGVSRETFKNRLAEIKKEVIHQLNKKK